MDRNRVESLTRIIQQRIYAIQETERLETYTHRVRGDQLGQGVGGDQRIIQVREMRKETKELDHTKPTAQPNREKSQGFGRGKKRSGADYMIGKLPTTNPNSD